MSALKQAIAELRNAVRPLRVPETTAIESAAAQIPDSAGMGKPREGKDYDKFASQLLVKINAGQRLGIAEAGDAAWCLWAAKPALASNPGALRAILKAIESSGRGPGRRLASAYLLAFTHGRAGIPESSGALKRLASRLGKPWHELQDRFALFDNSVGHEQLARAAVRQRQSPVAMLQNAGLRSLDSQSGFVKAATESALRHLIEKRGLDPHERFELAKCLALGGQGELLFQDCGPLLAGALTLPFADQPPDEGLRDEIIALLTGLFGDPRLKPGLWARMPDAEDVLRRWLTKKSLKDFLSVVDQVALERMFKYRRVFWEAVLDAELIKDAWVVFDPHGAHAAHRAFGKET